MPGLGGLSVKRDTNRRSTFDPWIRPNKDSSDPQEPIDLDDGQRSTLSVRSASEDGTRPTSLTGPDGLDLDARPPPRHPRHQPIEAHTRFSLLRFRNASEPQLSTKAKEHAGWSSPPPLPTPPAQLGSTTPAIIMTAPTTEGTDEPMKPGLKRQKSRFAAFTRQKQKNGLPPVEASPPRPSTDSAREKSEKRKSRFGSLRPTRGSGLDDLRNLAGSRGSPDLLAVNGQQAKASSNISFGRRSEDSRRAEIALEQHASSAPNGSPERPVQATQPHPPFAWLHRKRQNRVSLFPLPVKLTPAHNNNSNRPSTPRSSTGGRSSYSPDHSPIHPSPLQFANSRLSSGNDTPSSLGVEALAASTMNFTAPGSTLLRTCSVQSNHSTHSSPNVGELRSKARNRSSTMGSSDDTPPTPPFASTGSGRNSTSTAGRSSFSNLFTLNRLRHGSDPHSPRQSSQANHLSVASGLTSHGNSLNLSREVLHLPEREEGETAMQYLLRCEEVIPKSQLPTLLSKVDDEFTRAVMRSFMRKFLLFGDPLDMAIRKLLMEVDLPKETQQIDRFLQSFADRYHECNPGIFATADNAYFIAFSILILQTDAFNKNNKRKMSKQDYVKNSSIDGVSPDVLECFYDNIIYTPFIRVEDDEDIKTVRSRRRKKAEKAVKTIKQAVPEQTKKTNPKEPLDPYLVILDQKLDTLRPPIKEVMNLEDPYSYLGSAAALDVRMLKTSKTGILQIESARSRPNAFMSPSGIENPDEARAGIVELPVDKVGLLWRKDPKKKTARSPWQEWGAVLCGAGLYFFKNSTWVKTLIHQYENHTKSGLRGTPCTFKPAIQQFKPDYMLPTDHAVALQDGNYKRHKNAFLFFRHNGTEEVFLADNELEMNDWLIKLNQQAAFKTAGVRQRGLINGKYDAQRQKTLRRLESTQSGVSAQTAQTPIADGQDDINNQLALQISQARQETMRHQIADGEERLAAVIRQIDNQLRDARHLLCLAPIQPKTREQLVHAAGRMAAKLKWIRIEMWRMKCHRDILALDLEDEKKEHDKRTGLSDGLGPKLASYISHSSASTARPNRTNGIERLSSTASSVQSPNRATSQSQLSNRPDTKSSLASQVTEHDEDVFATPPEANTPMPTPGGGRRKSVEPLSLNIKPNRNSLFLPHSPRLAPTGEDDTPLSPAFSDYRTPILDDTEAERQREYGLASPTGDTDGTPDAIPPSTPSQAEIAAKVASDAADISDKPTPQTTSPDGRKVRRSLQRSLRDGNTPGSHHHHHHSHHHRPSISGSGSTFLGKISGRSESVGGVVTVPEAGVPLSAGSTTTAPQLGEQATVPSTVPVQEGENQLKREKGSFTVHGKKASVVTFGAEWASLPAEERLKIRKQAQTPLATSLSESATSPLRTLPTFERDYLNVFDEAAADDAFAAERRGRNPDLDLVSPTTSSSAGLRSGSFGSTPTHYSARVAVSPSPHPRDRERQSSLSSVGSATPVPTPRAVSSAAASVAGQRRASAATIAAAAGAATREMNEKAFVGNAGVVLAEGTSNGKESEKEMAKEVEAKVTMNGDVNTTTVSGEEKKQTDKEREKEEVDQAGEDKGKAAPAAAVGVAEQRAPVVEASA